MNRRLLIIALILQLSPSGFAQQQETQKQSQQLPRADQQQPRAQSDEDVVRISTNLVQVDSVITDSKGKQVTDLRADDVQILEDGKPQKITNFSYIALDSTGTSRPTAPAKPADKNAPPVPPARLKPEQVHRTIALVVDDLGLSFESAYYVRRALKNFLDQQMQPDDLVAIMRTGGGIGALQQFTSDKRQLYAAVENVKWNPSGRGGVSAVPPMVADPLAEASSPEAGPTASENLDQFREDLFAVGTLGTVNYVLRGLRTLPGRKSVVLISDGFKIFNRSEPQGSERILTALRSLTDLANRASVVIYTLDARGLQTLGLTAADSTLGMSTQDIEQSLSNRRTDFFESQNGLNYLAQQTGGLAFRNNNDLNAGIKRVIDDQQGYYLIGYRPDEATFDQVSGRRKFHNLSLKITRPGKFNVRMRNGFFGITDEEARPGRPQTRDQQLLGAITSPFGAAGVHVRLTSLFANDPKLGPVMRSMVHVKARDLTFTDEPDGWHKAVFNVLAITFGDNAVVVDQIGRTHTMQLKGKTYDRVLNEGFIYNLTVPVKKAGAYQLRMALRDVSSERVGSASQFIEVPDLKKNRLALSGILMRGVPLQAIQRDGSGSAQKENADDSVNESDPSASAAVRQFKQGLIMEYALVIYNAQLDKAAGKPQLQTQVRVFLNGQQVFSGKETPYDASKQPDLKRLPLAGAIQLGSAMAPGEYVLQVVVTDPLAKEKHRVASQWIDFEIVK